jgi:hypothetical protein
LVFNELEMTGEMAVMAAASSEGVKTRESKMTF